MTALLKPCGAKQGAVSLYLLLPTPVLLLCVCPLFPPTFISPVMEDCIRIKSNSVWIRTCCGCTTPLWQCWVEFCNLSLLFEDVFAAWSRFWGCFHQKPCPPFGIAPGNAHANSCSLSRCYHIAFTFCLSFGWCQNSIFNVDTSSHFQATSTNVLSVSVQLILAEMSDELTVSFPCRWHQPPRSVFSCLCHFTNPLSPLSCITKCHSSYIKGHP